MAIAYDNQTNGEAGSVDTVTWSHTTSGSDRFLLVHVSQNDIESVSSVTYGGVALTQIGSGVTNGGRSLALYYLANPATGANDVVVTFGGTSANVRCYALSYTGVHQTTPIDSSNSVNNSSGTVSTTVVKTNCWLVGGFYDSALATITASQTQRGTPGSDYVLNEDSNGTVSTGSQSLSVTGATASSLLGVVISLAATDSVVPSTGNFFQLL
jgi:hypothetical protein